MPVNKNAMTRYKILDELLSSRYHNYSLDDLTEEVSNRLMELYPDSKGVVRRTIEKDIYYLEYEGPFLVDIERYSVPSYNSEKQKSYTKQCLRYSIPSFSIFKKELSDDEKYLLRETLSLLGQFKGLPNLGALEGLRLSLDVRKHDNKIISFTKNPLEDSNLLGELFTSISQKQVIKLQYYKFSAPDTSIAINISPYLLKEYNRRWFLFGSAESDEKLLCFSLDRVSNIEALPSHKYKDYNGDIEEIFEDIIGVTLYEDEPLNKIYFWVSDASKDYVITKPIHESQRKVPAEKETDLRSRYQNLKGGKILRIDCKYNYELIRELSSFGKDLLVLEPDSIQNKVWERILAMYQDYEQLKSFSH